MMGAETIDLDQKTLGDFFDQAMQQAGLTKEPGSCVKDVWFSPQKKFAFIEV